MTSSPETLLVRHALFSGATPSERHDLLRLGWLESYPPRSLLYRCGEPYRGLHIVADGVIKSYRSAHTGRQLVLQVHGAGDACDEAPLFLDGPRRVHLATAEAVQPSTALFLPASPLLAYLDDHPHLYRAILSSLAARLVQMASHFQTVALYEVPIRIARYVWDQAHRRPPERHSVTLGLSKATLAAHLGTAPETLSRCLQSMKRDGLLSEEDGKVSVLNVRALRDLAFGSKSERDGDDCLDAHQGR